MLELSRSTDILKTFSSVGHKKVFKKRKVKFNVRIFNTIL